jgi:hypothetical protein
MLIASLSQIRYGPFLSALGPVAIFGLALDALVLVVMFRADPAARPVRVCRPVASTSCPIRTRRG